MKLDSFFSRYAAQEALFAEKPKRMALRGLDFPNDTTTSCSVNVWRNHAFETIAELAKPYESYSSLNINYRLSDYDDSLQFANYASGDIELIWLDSIRYQTNIDFESWLEWIAGRIKFLRGISHSPIIVATWLENESQVAELQSLVDSLTVVFFSDLRVLSDSADVELLDSRLTEIAGTALSSTAQMLVAREMACRWLPSLLNSLVKAVVLDLDNTLYDGVLGEDGVNGVRLTAGHLELQTYVKYLKDSGVFLALVSKNELQDVEDLFSQRNDFPLEWSDFSTVEVSWDGKGEAIERVANSLRISLDAILFVDDNPGELATVLGMFPSVHTIYASSDAFMTTQSISYYPGIWRWKVGEDDIKRIKDLGESAARDAIIRGASSQEDYFRSLDVTLFYSFDSEEQQSRVADLCKKTNQFNLAMSRLSPVAIAELIQRPDACVATVYLKDRLSDSGIIAVVVGVMVDKALHIEELCISCRALGRQLEDTFICGAIQGMPQLKNCNEVVFHVEHGARNQPALKWLAHQMKTDLLPDAGLCSISAVHFIEYYPVDGININKSGLL